MRITRILQIVIFTTLASALFACSSEQFEIVDQSVRGVGTGTLEVDCTVQNRGDTATALVEAKFVSDEVTYSESEQDVVESGEQRVFTFTFSGPEVFNETGDFDCSVS